MPVLFAITAPTSPALLAAARTHRAAETADATDAAARLWRDAGPWLRDALPDPFTVHDLRHALATRHLIANDGTEELRCLGTWPRKLGARKVGTRTIATRPGGHMSHRAIWSFAPSPLTEAPAMPYAANARDVLLASKAELIRVIAERTLQLETARAALRVIAEGDHDASCRDYARSQWALTDPDRAQSATVPRHPHAARERQEGV